VAAEHGGLIKKKERKFMGETFKAFPTIMGRPKYALASLFGPIGRRTYNDRAARPRRGIVCLWSRLLL